MTSRPSSAIQQDIELEVFKASFFQEKAEALRQQILDLEEKAEFHESNAREIASAEFGIDLVEPSLQMAKLSVPFLKEKFKSRAQSFSSADVTQAENVRAEQGSISEDIDTASYENIAPISSSENDVDDNADADAAEFFGVEVPPSRRDEARDIIDEAIAAVRKKSKTNIYASGRGKNAWRKHLFAAAWVHFANNDATAEASEVSAYQSQQQASDAVQTDTSDMDAGLNHVVEESSVISQEDIPSAHAENIEDAPEIPEFSSPDDPDKSEELADEHDEHGITEEEDSWREDNSDEWTTSEDDDVVIAGLDDISDEIAIDIGSGDEYEQSEDSSEISVASDHVTFSIEDTFFSKRGCK